MTAKKLASDHWNYVKNVIRAEWEAYGTTGADISNLDEHLKILEYHYKTAFIHGFKHGYEEYLDRS